MKKRTQIVATSGGGVSCFALNDPAKGALASEAPQRGAKEAESNGPALPCVCPPTCPP